MIGERAIDCEVNEDVEWEDETFFPEDDADQIKVDEVRVHVQSHAFSGTVEGGVEAHVVDNGLGSHLSGVLATIFDILCNSSSSISSSVESSSRLMKILRDLTGGISIQSALENGRAISD